MSQTQLAASRQAGESAEGAVLEAVVELGYVPDTDAEHYDARVQDVIVPDESLPTVGLPVLEVGLGVEIKSAIVRLASGQRGRFYVRRDQHERLLEDAGVYLFAVCKSSGRHRDVVAMIVVPATAIDELVDLLGGWRDAGDGRSEYKQIGWTNLIDVDRVEGGESR